MILPKSSLLISTLSKRDASIPGLDCIRFESDGTTVAASRNVVLAISPPEEEAKTNIPINDSGKCEATINCDLAKKVISAIGSDSAFGGKLEYCDADVDDSAVTFTTHDGRRKGTLSGRKERLPWIPWKKIFKNAGKPLSQRVILNRSRLKILLDVLDKISPENGGETPVYLEFTENNDVLLRAKNHITGQRILGIMTNYKGTWQEDTQWEIDILEGTTFRKPRRR